MTSLELVPQSLKFDSRPWLPVCHVLATRRKDAYHAVGINEEAHLAVVIGVHIYIRSELIVN